MVYFAKLLSSGTLMLAVCVGAGERNSATAQEKAKTSTGDSESGHLVELAGGKLGLIAPKTWKKKQPRTRIVQYEFAAPAVEGDKIGGRITIMNAGGGVDANIQRWIGQFTQPDGKPTKERAKTEELKVGGHAVHVVDITGTYKDQRGPFAPATMRDDYRMLGAIIATKKLGDHFIKLYGPKKTVAANEKAFRKMLNSLQQR